MPRNFFLFAETGFLCIIPAMFSIIKTFFAGAFVGMANVLPGVSGGTIAVICNVYDKLLLLSSLNLKQIRVIWKELLVLVLGIGAGLAGFAKIITVIYRLYPVQTNYFFIGIILGSVPFLYSRIKRELPVDTNSSQRPPALVMGWGLAGFMFIGGLYWLQRSGVHTAQLTTEVSALFTVKLVLLGVLAAFTMLIPGVSGSFILLILGAYQMIVQAVSDVTFPVLIPLGLGACMGLAAGARLITFLMEKFPVAVYSVIIGLALGSILYLLPQTCQPLMMRLLSAGIFLTGYSIVSFFTKKEIQTP